MGPDVGRQWQTIGGKGEVDQLRHRCTETRDTLIIKTLSKDYIPSNILTHARMGN